MFFKPSPVDRRGFTLKDRPQDLLLFVEDRRQPGLFDVETGSGKLIGKSVV